jgi:hypothetical protein
MKHTCSIPTFKIDRPCGLLRMRMLHLSLVTTIHGKIIKFYVTLLNTLEHLVSIWPSKGQIIGFEKFCPHGMLALNKETSITKNGSSSELK